MIDPQDLVRTAPIGDLLDAIATDPLGRHTTDDGRERFRCPRCGDRQADHHNPGRASMISPDRWRCVDCGHFGTRWALERHVLEDGIALDRLTFAMEVSTHEQMRPE